MKMIMLSQSLFLLSTALGMDSTMKFRHCHDERECSMLIAQSIVQGSQKCWVDSYQKAEHHFRNCVSDFCYTKCGQNGPCSEECEHHGHKIYPKINAFMQMRITSAMKDPDELAELKQENPGAYAIVKALLTKRSLGLLNPAHPSSSSMTSSSSSGQHRDWLHWKPADESQLVDDEFANRSLENPAPESPVSIKEPALSSTSTSSAANFLAPKPQPQPIAQTAPIAGVMEEKLMSDASIMMSDALPATPVSTESKGAPLTKMKDEEEDEPKKKPSLGSWASIFSTNAGRDKKVTEEKRDQENPYLASFGGTREALVAKHKVVTSSYLKDLE